MKLHPTLDLILGPAIMIFILIIFPAFVLWGIWSIFTNDASNAERSQISQNTKEIVWIEKSKDTIRTKLKDPSSARFKGVFFSNASGSPVACGEVNSKNSLGGYAGYQYFIAAGNSNLAFLENEVADFATVWNKMCRK